MYNEPVTGDGTITSDVLIKADPGYFEHNGKVTIAEGNWIDSVITVNSVGLDTTLTVAEGAYIDGKQIRVLDSVESGDYLNGEEAADAQAASYVEADGADVKSPVLYFHRLTSAQKDNIVVTYDYNGGIDAQGWSGCQKTSEEGATSYAHGTLPAPTRTGYVLTGWKYAVDNAPESLDMTGSEWLAEGAEETASVRLIAQWGYTVTYTDGVEGEEVFADKVFTEIVPGTATPAFTAPAREGYTFAGWTPAVEATVNGDALYTATWEVETVTSKPQLPAGDVEEEFPEEEVPTTDAPVVEEEEIFEEEDVPMADVPETGDPTALWAAMSVVSAAGILFIGKKNKDEE